MSMDMLAGTWMADPRKRNQLNHLIVQQLQVFLRDRVAPQSINGLCEDLQRAIGSGAPFLVTVTCAVIAELLVGAKGGEIFPNELRTKTLASHGRHQSQKDWVALVGCLRALRNACFHPAAVAKGKNAKEEERRRHVEELGERLRRRGEPNVADSLEKDYSFLRNQSVAGVTVRLVNQLGSEELARLEK